MHKLRLALVVLAGCGAEIQFTPTNRPPQVMTKRTGDKVEIFSAGPPPRPYVEVGLFSGSSALPQTTTPWVDDAAILKKLRREAGDTGCDALMIIGGSQDTIRATCLVYRAAAQ